MRSRRSAHHGRGHRWIRRSWSPGAHSTSRSVQPLSPLAPVLPAWHIPTFCLTERLASRLHMTYVPSDLLKKTPFHAIHIALKAKMVPFAGWEMPVQYPTGITAEHNAVRRKCGLFDVSHMGEFL